MAATLNDLKNAHLVGKVFIVANVRFSPPAFAASVVTVLQNC